jgi:hypothetical protein
MNEPIVTEDKQKRDWTPGEFAGMCFVQRLMLEMAGRSQTEIAARWVEKMVSAVRKHDKQHLVTVGVIPWSMTWLNAKSIIYTDRTSKHLDLVSDHFYPKTGEVAKALKALEAYNIGKPIVIEEMFPLNCSVADLDRFVEDSRHLAAGWIGFYWGKTIEEYKQTKRDLAEGMALDWLEYFARKTPSVLAR